MNPVFNAVARSLDWIASATGFTYNEINIIAYYIILPLLYVALIDRIMRRHMLKIIYLAGWTGGLCLIQDFTAFSNRIFNASVDFLLLFSRVGLDYVAASVVICVILPGIAFAVLLVFAFPTLVQKRFAKFAHDSTARPG